MHDQPEKHKEALVVFLATDSTLVGTNATDSPSVLGDELNTLILCVVV